MSVHSGGRPKIRLTDAAQDKLHPFANIVTVMPKPFAEQIGK
ncbi:hypothetical protein [Paraburkholderia adhaesiva]|nr:hypothetical protein [Paraburkholderia adhaesiva]